MKIEPPQARLDDLRRMASALLAASGVRPDRALILANLLLWHDESGFADSGLSTLPDLLERVAKGEVDPKVEPKVGPERAALAVLDGRGGVPLLVLARASEIASEKAREYGSGLVRVKGIGPISSAASVVSEIAIGPAIGAAAGPGGAWSVALPHPDGLPVIADAALGSDPRSFAGSMPWLPLLGPGEWLVQAVSVPAMEPLASFHERAAVASQSAPGTLLTPSRMEALRREARVGGVPISQGTRAALAAWAERLGVPE